jgi:death-on-curing protein
LLQNEPTWLTDSQVIEINQRLVAETGEPHFLRDPGLLSSALARPKNRWFYGDYDIVSLAGSLLLGIGQNHSFEQGNKRTALAATAVFLSFNGYTLVAPDGEPLSTFVEWSITGEISEPVFMEVLRQCIITTEEWEEYLRQKSELPES